MAVDDSYTVALLHMDGADASTTFTDESGKTWTARGNAQIDTAQSKFNGASGLFDGTGDNIDTPDHADFTVGSGDWTVDFWARRNATGRMVLFGQGDTAAANGSIQVEFDASNQPKVFIYYNAGANTANAVNTTAVTADSTWHHLAAIRSGNNLYMALDGTLSAATSVTGITVDNVATRLSIGSLGEYTGGLYYNGWMDEVRFSVGIARWTANFTPPTAPYSPFVPQVIWI